MLKILVATNNLVSCLRGRDILRWYRNAAKQWHDSLGSIQGIFNCDVKVAIEFLSLNPKLMMVIEGHVY